MPQEAEAKKPAVTINRRLNLVTKLASGRGTLHVFSTPVARSVFDDNFMTMCRAYAGIFNNQLGFVAGVKAAPNLIKREAEFLGETAKGEMLLQEIRRLTNVLVPAANGGGGYATVDYGVAVRQGLISEDDADDIDAMICFFTLASRVGPHFELEGMLNGLILFWHAEITSSTLMEYTNSLQTLTTGDATGQKAETPTVPPMVTSPANIPVTPTPALVIPQ